jgi:folylpolyglutamate synthase/dihydropteroate synthase
VEVAVCELLRELDATMIQPLVTAITSIGLDPGTLARPCGIAVEKAGILKPGVPVIVGAMAAEASRRSPESPATRMPHRPGLEGDGGRAAGARLQAAYRPGRRRTTMANWSWSVRSHQVDNAVVAVRLLGALDA